MLAKTKQVTISEFIRMLVVGAIANPGQSPLTIPAPIQKLPTARELRDDFVFGDPNDNDKPTE